MKKILLIVALTLLAATPLAAQQGQSQVVVSPNSSPEADQYAHVQLATQYGNSTATFNIPNGMVRHSLTFKTDNGVTGVTVTVSVSTGGTFTQVGTSSNLGDTITWSGTWSVAKVVITGFAGSGAVDADYRGSAPPAVMINTPNPLYSAPYGAPVFTVVATGNTAAAVVTANTVLIGTIYCVNTSASSATMVVTNTAGTYLVGGSAGFSIPANSDVTRNFFAGILGVGIKIWSGTTNVINCSVTGWQ